MTAAGARGETAGQIVGVLGLGGDAAATADALAERRRALGDAVGADVTLRTANALFPQRGYPFLEPFLGLLRTRFGSEARPLDFAGAPEAARGAINGWVAERTGQKIPELIPPGVLPAGTRLALVNAVYFKGAWQRPFKPSQTLHRPFTPAGGDPVHVPFMRQTGRFLYAEADGIQILELPYTGGRLVMTLALPQPGKTLADAAAPLFRGRAASGLAPVEVAVAVPRFSFTSFRNAGATLRALGVRDAFDAAKADLSVMNGTRDLFLAAVLHKAFIEVNEAGTEAAAATGAAVGVTSLPQPPAAAFTADRPFVFAIRETASDTLLFLGTLANPE